MGPRLGLMKEVSEKGVLKVCCNGPNAFLIAYIVQAQRSSAHHGPTPPCARAHASLGFECVRARGNFHGCISLSPAAAAAKLQHALLCTTFSVLISQIMYILATHPTPPSQRHC